MATIKVSEAVANGTEAAMSLLRASPLLASPEFLDRPAVIDGGAAWTWRQVQGDAIALALRIGDAPAVCNLCNSRLGFLVTLLAALRRRCRMVLPPSSSDADLDALWAQWPGLLVVADMESATNPWSTRHGRRPHLIVTTVPATSSKGAAEDELGWLPQWDASAVVLYTSGTTGSPRPHVKTLRQLATGALVLRSRLEEHVIGGVSAIGRIVCSVPSQHMFGLECSVMLPLLCGTPVVERRPLLPADVAAAFAGGPPGAWITTPMHLRTLAASAAAVPSCNVVIASTMPLACVVARASEQRVGAPVLEIYGSTETGVLAMRRTATETRWRPVDGVRVENRAGVNVANGSHFASPVELPDELLLAPDGSFTLLGRQGDLVKIAGKRASLTGLNLLLQEMPDLADGVFYLPATGSPTERLCLIYAGARLDQRRVRSWLSQRVDPVFLPRVFIRVDRLPRNENGKLSRVALDHVFTDWQSGTREPNTPRSSRVVTP